MLSIKLSILVIICVNYVSSGCRNQSRKECESLCRIDVDGNRKCELRIAIILPNSSNIEASLMRVSSKEFVTSKKISIFSLILPFWRIQDGMKIFWMLKNVKENKIFLNSIFTFDLMIQNLKKSKITLLKIFGFSRVLCSKFLIYSKYLSFRALKLFGNFEPGKNFGLDFLAYLTKIESSESPAFDN